MVDIHTHILPSLDDGAENIEESLNLLRELKFQGVNAVIATPHFYPQTDNSSEFFSARKASFSSLAKNINEDLPKVYLGCELLYYENIGFSNSISQFCLLDSNYLLLELTDDFINEKLFMDLLNLKSKNIIPIIAHIERYASAKNYRKLLKFIKKEKILSQINASAVLDNYGYKIVKKLIKKDIVSFIATDTHSIDFRPPQMAQAIEVLNSNFGKEYTEKLISNSRNLANTFENNTESEPNDYNQ